jgi:putative ABC transport system substrate-binding protein
VFNHGLNELGYFEGQSLVIEYRWAELQYDRPPGMATDLVRRGMAVIAAVGGIHSGLAAKAATPKKPIVFVSAGDPVLFGLVPNLNRPGGNVTGISMISVALAPKRLELLHELMPNAATIGMLVNPTSPYFGPETKDVLESARAVGLRIYVAKASTPEEIDASFTTIVQQQAGALLVSGDSFFDSQRDKLVALAAQHALPAIYQWREFVEIGGLMSYGTSITDACREAGVYVGKILNGANPSDLPVPQPDKLELLVNFKTATALGITIPPSTRGDRMSGKRVAGNASKPVDWHRTRRFPASGSSPVTGMDAMGLMRGRHGENPLDIEVALARAAGRSARRHRPSARAWRWHRPPSARLRFPIPGPCRPGLRGMQFRRGWRPILDALPVSSITVIQPAPVTRSHVSLHPRSPRRHEARPFVDRVRVEIDLRGLGGGQDA